jgi:hypothetical protein
MPDLCVSLCVHASLVRPAGLTPEDVHQAFHAQLMLHSQIARQAGTPLSSLAADHLPTLPDQLAAHAKHMWLASAVDVHVSKLQTDVSGALAMAGIPNTIEWLTDDGLFSIDIAFEVRVGRGVEGYSLHWVLGQLLGLLLMFVGVALHEPALLRSAP